ncbi:MAG: hypothetical protein E6J39_06880 [Chloroflexi bacterium]|nr:MAG: hypothetical protein E6J39_06880 [Chloroflexota bacterium]
MRRSRRSTFLVTAVMAVLAASTWQPALVAGRTSAGQGSQLVARIAGSVVLPNGRVLPPAPPGSLGPSEMAVQWRAHANDRISFHPGAKPRKLEDAPIVLAAEPSTVAGTELIPLAPTDGSAAAATLASLPNGLRKQVFGFLPYWTLNASDLQWMQYGLVSTIAYFGVAARSNGTLATTSTGWNGWNSSAMTGVINAAHRKGDKLVITITMMAWDSASAAAQATLLGNATYRTQLVNNIVAAVRNRNADGVNLDFEPLATTLRAKYVAFVRQLKAALVAAGVGSYLTVCTTAGAATWATGYDLTALTASGASDGIFAMGYDYSWSGSSRAGAVAPMESSYMLDVNQSVSDFLSMMPAAKLIWGVPYYGRTWHTTSSALNAATVAGASGYSKAYYYTGAKSLAAAHGRRWDSVGQVPWFVYYDPRPSLGLGWAGPMVRLLRQHRPQLDRGLLRRRHVARREVRHDQPPRAGRCRRMAPSDGRRSQRPLEPGRQQVPEGHDASRWRDRQPAAGDGRLRDHGPLARHRRGLRPLVLHSPAARSARQYPALAPSRAEPRQQPGGRGLRSGGGRPAQRSFRSRYFVRQPRPAYQGQPGRHPLRSGLLVRIPVVPGAVRLQGMAERGLSPDGVGGRT